jgi:hypothetical protein
MAELGGFSDCTEVFAGMGSVFFQSLMDKLFKGVLLNGIIVMGTIQSALFVDDQHQPMGFADLSIADLAAEYDLTIETVFRLCDQLQVTYKDRHTNLALEDAKAIISLILAGQSGSNTQTQDSLS